MLRNYFTSAIRALAKNKVFSFINVLGIAIGLASVMVIALYVNDETSYDSFFQDSDRIYRIALKRVYPERERLFASSAAIMADVINDNYPEVEIAARLHRMFFVSEIPVEVGDDVFNEGNFYFADSNYFKLFSYEFIHGDPNTALNDPNSIVISSSTAIKYFGRTDVLNETVAIDTTNLMISGIIKDIPTNSHIQFDILGSIRQVGYLVNAIDQNNWVSPWLYTYVKLNEGINADQFESKLDSMVLKYGSGTLSQSLGANFSEEGHKFEYFLQPLEDIHLHSSLDTEIEANGDYSNVIQLSIIALIILLISTINFINLSTARSAERAREVGVRKVMGSLRSDLFFQFISESILMTFLGFIIALGMVALILPFFNTLLSKSLSVSLFFSPMILTGLFLFILLVGFLSGTYPALSMSSFNPSTVLKGSFKVSTKGVWLRNFLIVFQFFISIIMIATTVAVNSQMKFLKSKDVGFKKENVLVISNGQTLGDNAESFRNELLNLQGIQNVGGTFAMPGDFIGSAVMRPLGIVDAMDFRVNTVTIDDYFFETMGFELADGRSFSPSYNDSLSIIVNEALIGELNLEDPLGSRLISVTNSNEVPELTIVGVVKDYNFTSLHSQISPLILFNGNSNFVPPIISVRVDQEKSESLLPLIEEKWQTMSDEPFSYSFLDRNLENQYREDMAAANLFDVFTYLAIFISCIGLFGLATYIVQQKTREMGIRKVMGATAGNISALFMRDFLKLTLIAFVLAIPASYWAIQQWMGSFAYHIPISISIFLIAGILTVGIIVLTLVYQIFKIIHVNPVDTIRD